MNRPFSFGVVGGYGGTGAAVVTQLSKCCKDEILIGGRKLDKAHGLAAQFHGKVSATHLEVLDAGSLDEFCGRCAVVINCAGPTLALQDRVALAAIRRQCHYVDPGGFSYLAQRLLPHALEIANLGLSFVLSAGWVPGVSEVLPRYAASKARTQMDVVESLSMYFGDSSEWSSSALRDGIWYTRHPGHLSPGYFLNGKWIRAKTAESYPRVDLGAPIGSGRFCMFSTPELADVGSDFRDCRFSSYAYLGGASTVISGALIRLLPLPEKLALPLMRTIFRSAHLSVGGFILVRANGCSEGRSQVLGVLGTYDEHRQYWANGIVPAITAKMILEGTGVGAGVHYLGRAVDPVIFMANLQESEIKITETFLPGQTKPVGLQQ